MKSSLLSHKGFAWISKLSYRSWKWWLRHNLKSYFSSLHEFNYQYYLVVTNCVLFFYLFLVCQRQKTNYPHAIYLLDAQKMKRMIKCADQALFVQACNLFYHYGCELNQLPPNIQAIIKAHWIDEHDDQFVAHQLTITSEHHEFFIKMTPLIWKINDLWVNQVNQEISKVLELVQLMETFSHQLFLVIGNYMNYFKFIYQNIIQVN